jgi:hypothetical protein
MYSRRPILASGLSVWYIADHAKLLLTGWHMNNIIKSYNNKIAHKLTACGTFIIDEQSPPSSNRLGYVKEDTFRPFMSTLLLAYY